MPSSHTKYALATPHKSALSEPDSRPLQRLCCLEEAGLAGLLRPRRATAAASVPGRWRQRRRRLSRGDHAYVFPLQARHSYGDGFGAGRDHQGQDVFAKCGSKLVAARSGRVQTVDSHGSAGNYIVIDGNSTGHRHRLHAPQEEGDPARGLEAFARARRSAKSATPATPRAVTSTSRSGPRPATTRAATPRRR